MNDDEQIVLPPNSGPKPIVEGRVDLVIKNNSKVPLEENSQKLLLELTGGDKSRAGLDLVAVLDVSGSMSGDKLAKMQEATKFVVKKLGLVDRFSIVQYSSKAKRLCPLRQVTESSRAELENLIQGLKAGGGTNMEDGLQIGLDVLKQRKFGKERVGVVMLMTDGQENEDSNAAGIDVGDVPVHTFGFGDDQDAKVLKAIADNSRLGGTYSDVRLDNLSVAFSLCLGGLLSVVAQDLTLTVSQIDEESTIKQVTAGRYPQFQDADATSITIKFGDLYTQESRKVLVELFLPATNRKRGADILEVTYTYKFEGETFEANPSTITVRRTDEVKADQQQPPPEVSAEDVRLGVAEIIKQATTDADNNKLESARNKLLDGLKTLQDGDKQQLKAALRVELEELHELMKSEPIYEKEGRPFAYSLLTSHDTQRQAARGNDVGKFQLFATPLMREFLGEPQKFDDINNLDKYTAEVLKALESVEAIINNI
ncbi:hypothetical protein LUZ61_003021 [Rhynchospora tenuis]|uniref:VWFA domain-containing protein n=1 Tax=Rhynchospora tenuis TaxID=198213 RepID=A0AAD5ZK00_9POAL|nr:hypothetical protein LUZ61_003021 [Rhynchospora tenuis]